jgi:aminoglycoside/choline kinase family phosphotransferase
MPNTRVEAPNNVVGQIVSNGYRVPINRNGLAGRLGFGGSDRSFYRVGYKGQSAIRMQTTSDDPDFQRHIEYTRLFKRHGIPVPELLKVEDLTAFFEDLGDLSLYNWLKCNREEKAIFETYHKVIDALVRLHSLKLDQDSPPFRDFDYEYFRWETDYFLREFVNGYLGIQWVPPQVLYDLDRLALEAASFKKVIIHRDLQSQNIMIKGDGTIAFIDYQGARFGPPAYDVASLCFDPYVDIDVSLRMRFCDTYKSVIIAIDETFDVTTFDRSLQICRLQRLMQALGAYAYLSLKKGRFHFLKYIPSALSLLKDSVVGSGDQFLGLKNLIQTIKTRVHTLDRPLKPV